MLHLWWQTTQYFFFRVSKSIGTDRLKVKNTSYLVDYPLIVIHDPLTSPKLLHFTCVLLFQACTAASFCCCCLFWGFLPSVSWTSTMYSKNNTIGLVLFSFFFPQNWHSIFKQRGSIERIFHLISISSEIMCVCVYLGQGSTSNTVGTGPNPELAWKAKRTRGAGSRSAAVFFKSNILLASWKTPHFLNVPLIERRKEITNCSVMYAWIWHHLCMDMASSISQWTPE